MIKSSILLILFFYILALIQTSFLTYFNVSGIVPNLILVSVILINLFQRTENPSGLIGAVIGGFFLDVFSNRPIGFEILILLLVAIFIKVILKNYVRIPYIARV